VHAGRRVNRKGFIAALAGCAVAPAFLRPPRGIEGDPSIITLSGAGPEGRWFAETSLFGKVLTREIPGLTVNGVIGKGVSIGNIRRIAAGDVEGGRFYPFDLENAHANRPPFETGDYGDVAVWMKLGMNLFRVVAEAGIRQFSDLAGRTVAIGVRGSGDDFLAHQILGAYGINASNTRFHYIGRGDGQAALAAGEIDAVAFSYTRNNQGHLGPVFASRRLGDHVDFVEPDADRNAAFLAAQPAFFLDTRGEPVFGRPELSGIAYNQGMSIHRRISDDLVYRMTRVLYENWDEILSAAPWWSEPGEATLDEAAALSTLPYHPGARRYYEEMGVWRRHQAG
jgi:hypothetical protein